MKSNGCLKKVKIKKVFVVLGQEGNSAPGSPLVVSNPSLNSALYCQGRREGGLGGGELPGTKGTRVILKSF